MNEKINLQELTGLLSEKAGTTKKEAENFLREFFDLISEALISEKQLKIKNLGTFKLVEVEDRQSVNVRTGERVLIPAHSKVSFSPDKQLSEIINEPFALFEAVEVDEDAVIDPAPTEENGEVDEADENPEPEQEVIDRGEDNPNKVVEQEEIKTAIAELPKEDVKEGKTEVKTPEVQKIQEDIPVENTDEPEEPEKSGSKNKTFKTISIAALVTLSLTALIVFFPQIKSYFSEDQVLIIERDPDPVQVPVTASIPDTTTSRMDSSGLHEEPQAPVVRTDTVASETSKETPAKASTRKRTIKAGERLTVISLKEYGDKIFWVYLYEENKKIIENPNSLPIGLEIVIPPASKYGIDIKNPESVSKAKKLAENYK